jgi:hypothetical protein
MIYNGHRIRFLRALIGHPEFIEERREAILSTLVMIRNAFPSFKSARRHQAVGALGVDLTRFAIDLARFAAALI